MLKITIPTSIWSVQHPNAGQNRQQMVISKKQIKLSEYLTFIVGAKTRTVVINTLDDIAG